MLIRDVEFQHTLFLPEDGAMDVDVVADVEMLNADATLKSVVWSGTSEEARLTKAMRHRLEDAAVEIGHELWGDMRLREDLR